MKLHSGQLSPAWAFGLDPQRLAARQQHQAVWHTAHIVGDKLQRNAAQVFRPLCEVSLDIPLKYQTVSPPFKGHTVRPLCTHTENKPTRFFKGGTMVTNGTEFPIKFIFFCE